MNELLEQMRRQNAFVTKLSEHLVKEMEYQNALLTQCNEILDRINNQ
jgi:hypothetical protein